MTTVRKQLADLRQFRTDYAEAVRKHRPRRKIERKMVKLTTLALKREDKQDRRKHPS
jgi:hypothetical protein